MGRPVRFQRILGIRFIVATAQEAIDEVSHGGGLVAVPAAPALKNLSRDERYRDALLGADFALADSTLMVLVWNLLQRDTIPKLSGLKYLRALIEQPQFREPRATFWVMSGHVSARRNLSWLNANRIDVPDENVYVAPIYGKNIADPELLRRLEELRPHHIVVCLGGGTQEPLGLYLKQHLSYKPAIHCIGAAIAFLSGDQVKIPVWVDHMGLGWLWRSLSNPLRYGPRYWDARLLVSMMLRYRDRLPSFGAGLHT